MLPKDIMRLMAKAGIPKKECWDWTGFVQPSGYGKFRLNGKTEYAMRLMHEIFIGQIPDGLHVDHLCRNRKCVNPWHLEPVSQKMNVYRGVSPTAFNAQKTHCKYGHPFIKSNTYVHKKKKSGNLSRVCVTCRRAKAARAYRKASGSKRPYRPTNVPFDKHLLAKGVYKPASNTEIIMDEYFMGRK